MHVHACAWGCYSVCVALIVSSVWRAPVLLMGVTQPKVAKFAPAMHSSSPPPCLWDHVPPPPALFVHTTLVLCKSCLMCCCSVVCLQLVPLLIILIAPGGSLVLPVIMRMFPVVLPSSFRRLHQVREEGAYVGECPSPRMAGCYRPLAQAAPPQSPWLQGMAGVTLPLLLWCTAQSRDATA